MWQKHLAAAETGPCSEPFIVVCENAFFTKALGETFQQHLMRLVAGRRQTIVHPKPLLSRNDKAGLAQIGQVPRGGGLRNIQNGHDMANAQFAALEQVENPQSSSVGKCPKNRLRLRLSSLGFHIRLHEYIGWLSSGQ